MTRRRWIADEVAGTRAALTGEHAAHLVRVLRARVGQEFDIAAGGTVRRGRIVTIHPDRVELELGDEIQAPAMRSVTLVLSIFKFDRMEWAIEKCTELGVARIVPAIAQRTEKHLAATADKRAERWRRIAMQASEQSRLVTPPEVCLPMKLKEAVNLTGGCRIVLAEGDQDLMLTYSLRSCSEGAVLLAFGPEGGWTEAELRMFQGANWMAASLGPTILRAETAAIAATAVAMAEL
jgi:16S rRNA (uracil1498-N3)-methyltransferase